MSTNPEQPPTSPTGRAVVNLPQWLTILCAALIPACGTVAAAGADAMPKWAIIACVAIGASAAAVLGLGTGLRDRSQPPGPLMLALLLGLALLAPRTAFAQQLTVGPSLPFVQVTPGDTHPVAIAPGAGVTVGCDFFPAKLLGRDVSILSIGGDLFGALVSNGPTIAANVSIAVHAALYELFSVGVGLKLYDSAGSGVLAGSFTGRSVFLLVGIDYGLIHALMVGHTGTAPSSATDYPPPLAE